MPGAFTRQFQVDGGNQSSGNQSDSDGDVDDDDQLSEEEACAGAKRGAASDGENSAPFKSKPRMGPARVENKK